MFGAIRGGAKRTFESTESYLNDKLPYFKRFKMSWVLTGVALIASPAVGIVGLAQDGAKKATGVLKLETPDVKVDFENSDATERYKDYLYAEPQKQLAKCTFRKNSNESYNLDYKGKNRKETLTLTPLGVKNSAGHDLYVLVSDKDKLKDLGFKPENAIQDSKLVVAIDGNGKVQAANNGTVQVGVNSKRDPYLWMMKSADGSNRYFASLLMLPLNLGGAVLGLAGSIAGGVINSAGNLCNSACNRLTKDLGGKIGAAEVEAVDGSRPQKWLMTRTVAGAALGFAGTTLKTSAMGIHGVCRTGQALLMSAPRVASAALNRNSFDLKLAGQYISNTAARSFEEVKQEAKEFPRLIKTTHEHRVKISEIKKDAVANKKSGKPDVTERKDKKSPKQVGGGSSQHDKNLPDLLTEAIELKTNPQLGQTGKKEGEHPYGSHADNARRSSTGSGRNL